jgi:riboflavin kinase/FMN adenylyltransferase
MEIVHGSANFPPGLPSPVVTIGNFDGVHVGHQKIFRTVIDRARALGGTSVCYTFDPHPQRVLAPDRCPPLIVTPRKKLALIGAEGIAITVVEAFTQAFSRQGAEEFIRHILFGRLHPVEVYVGHDFHFGKGREASFATLEDLGARLRLRVEVIEEVTIDGAEVSSSRIRRLVAAGQVEEAARLLGRAFTLEGLVEPGAGRGRAMGIATANLAIENELLPADGVYAIFGRLGEEGATAAEGVLIPGVANIGFAPSFGGTRRTVEAHLLDVDRDLYGLPLEILLLARLRDERKFPDAGSLVAQIRKDIEAARRVHAAHGRRPKVPSEARAGSGNAWPGKIDEKK